MVGSATLTMNRSIGASAAPISTVINPAAVSTGAVGPGVPDRAPAERCVCGRVDSIVTTTTIRLP